LAVKTIENWINPWIQSRGGWKRAFEENEDDTEESDSDIIEKYKKKLKKKNKNGKSEVKWPVIMMMVIMIFEAIKGANGIVAYDCSRPKFGAKYSLIEVEQCPEASPIAIEMGTEKVMNIYQESDYIYTEARECIIKYTESVFRCGKYDTQPVKPEYTPDPVQISAKQCEEAFLTGKFQLEKDVVVDAKIGVKIKTNMNIVGWATAAGWCEGGKYKIWGQTHDKLVVRRQYVTELRKFQATFDSITRKMMTHPFCFADETSCETGESIIIYRVDPKECSLALLKTVNFKTITGNIFDESRNVKDEKRQRTIIRKKNTPTIYISAKEEDMMKFIEKEKVIKCQNEVIETNYKGIYLSEKLIRSAKDSINKFDVKALTYMHNKVDYLYHYSLMTTQKLYHETIKNDCKLNYQVLQLKVASATVNPELIAPMLFYEKGTFARVMGETLQVFSCKLVQVSMAIIEKCTNELPVIYKGVQVFLLPVTRILTDKKYQPKIIEKCTNIMDPAYQIGPDNWITVSDRKPTATPEKLGMAVLEKKMTFKTFDNLEQSGIYSYKDLEAARREMLFPVQRESFVYNS